MTQQPESSAILERGTVVTIRIEGQGSYDGKVIKYKSSRNSYLVRCRRLSKTIWISADLLLKRT